MPELDNVHHAEPRTYAGEEVVDGTVSRDVVKDFIRKLGFDPNDVISVNMYPDRVEIDTLLYRENGRPYVVYDAVVQYDGNQVAQVNSVSGTGRLATKTITLAIVQ